MATDRPTAEERADAADRFIAAVDEAQNAIAKAHLILSERRERASGYYPLFTWGDQLRDSLDKASEPLRSAHREAAIQVYDERRRATQLAEAGAVDA